MRFWSWFCLLLGFGCLVGAVVLGVHAVQQAAQMSAYHDARACPSGAPTGAGCLQTVPGAVTAVTEFPGSGRVSADYALDVRTASTILHLTFTSDSAMLANAINGDPAVVTMWRGVPVSVRADGRSEETTSVPRTAFARDVGNAEEAASVGMFLLFIAWAIRRNRRLGGMQPLTRPAHAAALMALLLGSIVVAFGGIALGGKPSRLGPDLAATGAALVLVLGLSAWVGLRIRNRAPAAELIPGQIRASGAHSVPPRARPHPASWARVLGGISAGWLAPALTVAVLFGIAFTSHDGPPARAYRQAPACAGEANLATCAGNFTAVINGVRSPANGASFADVSYVTQDGAINAWAQIDGNAAAISRSAEAEMRARTPLRIRAWRQAIVGAELGGRWQWANGNPPGNTIPAVFLAVSFTSLLLVVRMRIHRRAGSGAGASRQRLLFEDAGQAIAAAASVVLLAYGFWPGAILALAALVWLALSAGSGARWRNRTPLTALR